MITQQEYQGKKKKIGAEITCRTALQLFPLRMKLLRNGDTHYRFRQDSNFYYLTGFNEPDALLVIDSVKKIKVFYLIVHIILLKNNGLENVWAKRGA